MILLPLSYDEYPPPFINTYLCTYWQNGKVTTKLVLLNSLMLENAGNWKHYIFLQRWYIIACQKDCDHWFWNLKLEQPFHCQQLWCSLLNWNVNMYGTIQEPYNKESNTSYPQRAWLDDYLFYAESWNFYSLYTVMLIYDVWPPTAVSAHSIRYRFIQ